jgi:hypothetical protein
MCDYHLDHHLKSNSKLLNFLLKQMALGGKLSDEQADDHRLTLSQ